MKVKFLFTIEIEKNVFSVAEKSNRTMFKCWAVKCRKRPTPRLNWMPEILMALQPTDFRACTCCCVGSWGTCYPLSCLSLFLDSHVRPGSPGRPTPSCGCPSRSRTSSGGSIWCSSCGSSTKYGGDFSLHERPRRAVWRVIQWTTLSTWAVHLSITSSALYVHSGAGETEPVHWK